MTGTEVPGRVSPNAYVGPVHNVDHSELFTSVLVPHPEHKDLLVWMNIWTARGPHNCPVHFAHVVTERSGATRSSAETSRARSSTTG